MCSESRRPNFFFFGARWFQVLEPFPDLKPLVGAMGWDLVGGDTEARRRMMQMMWMEGRAARTNQDATPGQQAGEVNPPMTVPFS